MTAQVWQCYRLHGARTLRSAPALPPPPPSLLLAPSFTPAKALRTNLAFPFLTSLRAVYAAMAKSAG